MPVEVDVATTELMTALSGLPVVDGEQTEIGWSVAVPEHEEGERVGVWRIVNDGPWERDPAFATGYDMAGRTEFRVVRGATYGGSTWFFDHEEPPEVGIEPLSIIRASAGYVPTFTDGLRQVEESVGLVPLSGVAGTYALPKQQMDQFGRVVAISSGAIGSGYIEGLGLRYNSLRTVALEPGAAFVPGRGTVVEAPERTLAEMPQEAYAIRYAYLGEVGGVGYLVLDDNPPDPAYFGSACVHETDQNLRYVGMIRNDRNGQVLPFQTHVLGGSVMLVHYTDQLLDKDTIIVDGYTAGPGSLPQYKTINPDADTLQARVVSPNSTMARIYADLQYASADAFVGYSLGAGAYARVSPGRDYFEVALSDDQRIHYQVLQTGASLTLYGAGYYERR